MLTTTTAATPSLLLAAVEKSYLPAFQDVADARGRRTKARLIHAEQQHVAGWPWSSLPGADRDWRGPMFDFRLRGDVDAATLAAVLDGFGAEYHDNFEATRLLARRWLDGEPIARPLAWSLSRTLRLWGAGDRAAPHVSSVAGIAACLDSEALRAGLGNLESFAKGEKEIADNDLAVLVKDALVRLAEGILIGNTNITYPMKACMLLSGAMVAFDSQVRAGLRALGYRGFSSTQNLLPNDLESKSLRRIVDVVKAVRSGWLEDQARLLAGLDECERRADAAIRWSPGRFYDVLLFEGGEVFRSVQ